VRIVLTVLTQILLVPGFFLPIGSVEQYGCWLIVQTIVGFVVDAEREPSQLCRPTNFSRLATSTSEKMRALFLFGATLRAAASPSLELLAIGGFIYLGFVQEGVRP